ncbi:MAG: VOC family protein [Bryobacteraceae bacterium]
MPLENASTSRRQWITQAATLATSSLLAMRASAQQKLLPLKNSGLDHVSITVKDSLAAAKFYGPIFDPQVFHERTGVQRYYVRLGAAYIALGPQPTATPYIDHIAAGVIGFDEDKFADTKPELTAAGLNAPPGVLPMLGDPDNLRLQLVNTTHGLFDTLMPGGRVTTEPAALIPIGLDHIMISVTDIEKSVAHYRKLFGQEESRENKRVWFKLADTKLGLQTVAAGQKPSFSSYCVKIAGYDKSVATARLAKLGIKVEPGIGKNSLRFRDLYDLSVEVVGG